MQGNALRFRPENDSAGNIPRISPFPPFAAAVRLSNMPFHKSLALFVLSSLKSISKMDDARRACAGGVSFSFPFAFSLPLAFSALLSLEVVNFDEEGEKCNSTSFSKRRSKRVRSMRSRSCAPERAARNSSVRGWYTPFGWKPGRYAEDALYVAEELPETLEPEADGVTCGDGESTRGEVAEDGTEEDAGVGVGEGEVAFGGGAGERPGSDVVRGGGKMGSAGAPIPTPADRLR